MQTSSGQHAINPAEIASEAWAMARANWKLFLGWATLPIVVSLIADMISTEAFRLRNTESLELLVYVIAAYAVSFVNGWLSAPYRVRVYRYAALGEISDVFYGMQLWEERTWQLIWKTILVDIQLFLLELVTALIPSGIAVAVLKSKGFGVDSTVFQYVVYGCVASVGVYAAAYVFAPRVILTYAGVSLGEKYTIAQYAVFGGPARASMAKVMVLIWAPVAVLSHFVGFGNFFLWDSSALMIYVIGFINNTLFIVTGMASLAAGALIYKRLSPGFAEKSAEYAHIRQEIREIGAWKAKGSPEDSRPASASVTRCDQPK